MIPQLAESLGIGPALIGVLVATFPLGIVVGFPVAGAAVRIRSSRAVLLVSLAVLAAGLSDSSSARGSVYVVSRFVMGLTSGGLGIAVTFCT